MRERTLGMRERLPDGSAPNEHEGTLLQRVQAMEQSAKDGRRSIMEWVKRVRA